MPKQLKLIAVVILAVLATSCSDNDEPNAESIVGSWFGTRTYYNPVGGQKYQYLTLSFGSDGTGSMEYESPVSYSAAKFTYKVKGQTVNCVGAYANTYGDVDSDFKLTLSIKGDRLIPTNKFTYFILTRDNSVMTDGDGNEIID